MAARLFTLQEAESLLPEVEAAVRQAISLKQEMIQAQLERQAWLSRVASAGGTRVDHSVSAGYAGRVEESANRLQSTLNGIEALGCLMKDLDMGLLDFPTVFQGEEVYLCWKLGERSIGFWHGVTEGFQGRKPIDDHFLRNHTGERLH